MDKAVREQKRQQAGEALTAWKEVVKQAKEAKRPDATNEKDWLSSWKEKKEKAKEVFTALSNELASAENEEAEEAELSAAEQQFSRQPVNRLEYKSEPAEAQEVPQNGNGAGYGETMDLSDLSGRMRTNTAKMLGSSREFYSKLGVDKPAAKKAHNEMFMARLRYGAGSDQFVEAKENLKAILPKNTFALLSTSDPGFLVPEDFDARVIKDLAGFAVIRGLARVERTGSDVLVFPSVNPAAAARANQGYVSGFEGSFKAQRTASGGATALTVQNQPVFGQERIQVHRWEPDAIELSVELIEDSAADVMGLLSEIIAETRAMDEDAEFTNGDGQGRPLGLLQAGMTSVASGAAGTWTYAGLTGILYSLRAQYCQNATWMMNSDSFGEILAVEDGGSHLIFPPNAIPGTLFNRPVAFNEFMPAPTAGLVAAILGDFRFYVIADRMELRIQRLDERAAPNVALLPWARLGGQVVRVNAFRVSTIGA